MKYPIEILLIFTVCLISRLVFIDTNVFFFDGDEAIVGLMSLDILDGKFPLYFYGQTYGFSFIEAFLISIWIYFFGVSYVAIKIPMLLLFNLTLFFIYLILKDCLKIKRIGYLLFIAILIFSPTWLVWSMKARGGYLTSFFFSTLLIYLLLILKEKVSLNLLWGIFLGIFIAIVFESQPLWIPPIIPIIIYFFYSSQLKVKTKILLGSITAFSSMVILFSLGMYKDTLTSAWDTPTPNPFGRLKDIKSLPNILIDNLGGNYFLNSTYDPSNWTYSLTYLLLILFVLVLYLKNFSKKNNFPIFMFLAMLLSLSGFLFSEVPRYLLPFFVFGLLFMVSVFSILKHRIEVNIFKFLMFLTIFIGLFSFPNFLKYSFNNMSITKVDYPVKNDQKILLKLLSVLKSEKIKYLYSSNELLQYQITFLSNREIIATSKKDRSRTPWNFNIVSKNISNTNQFGIVGFNFHNRYENKLPLIDGKIFYLLKPDVETISTLGLDVN